MLRHAPEVLLRGQALQTQQQSAGQQPLRLTTEDWVSLPCLQELPWLQFGLGKEDLRRHRMAFQLAPKARERAGAKGTAAVLPILLKGYFSSG